MLSSDMETRGGDVYSVCSLGRRTKSPEGDSMTQLLDLSVLAIVLLLVGDVDLREAYLIDMLAAKADGAQLDERVGVSMLERMIAE